MSLLRRQRRKSEATEQRRLEVAKVLTTKDTDGHVCISSLIFTGLI